MRERIWSALSPPSTVNGSTGVCRKRDFFFMRDDYSRVLRRMLERAADAQVRGRSTVRAGAVMSNRSADSERERNEVAGNDVGRQFDAGRCLDVAGMERPGPDVARVHKHGG